MNKIKVKDEVVVIAGKDKGKTGTVAKIFWSKSTVLVNGVNLKQKAVKPTEENPNGGFAQIETPISLSNVMLKSPKSGEPTRVKIVKEGNKNKRKLLKCGSVLD